VYPSFTQAEVQLTMTTVKRITGCVKEHEKHYRWIRSEMTAPASWLQDFLTFLLILDFAKNKYCTYCVYSHKSRKNFGTVLPPQNRGVDLYAGHTYATNFAIMQMMSAELGTEGSRQSAAVGHWHVTLVCVIWYCSEMNGRERRSAFRAALSPADQRHSSQSYFF